jgi:hypothetical protein
MRRIGLLVLALFAGPAWAEVTLTFYAHPGARVRDGNLLFPHAFVQATGTLAGTGETVDWAAGFTARNPGPHLLFMRGTGVVELPNPRYVGDGKPYLTLVVSDADYRAVRARADWWNSPEGSVYDLQRRNCITFIADLARLAGLQTADEPSLKPGTFLEATAALNPHAAWKGPAPEGPVTVAVTEPAAGPPPAGR